MTSVPLPTSPLPKQATPRPLDFGAWQTPSEGGPAQRLDRPGSRFAMDVVTPNLQWTPGASAKWVSRLLQGVGSTVVYPFPQRGIDIGSPGTPVVDGAGQAGSTILLRGFAPGYEVSDPQFFSIIISGQRYLYCGVGDRVADGSGKVALPIWPAIRVSPPDGATCEFAQPMIEGALSGNDKGWTYERAHTIGLNFTITEIE